MLAGLAIGIALGSLINGLLIWIVGRMRLGMEVDGFGPAFLAGIVVSVLNGLISFVWTNVIGYEPPSQVVSAIFTLLIAASVLQIAGNRVSGLRVKGFRGALIAAVAMAAIAYVLAMALTGMAM